MCNRYTYGLFICWGTQVRFEYFKRKNVYLLISSWKISEEDLMALSNIYKDPNFHKKPPAEEAGMITIEGAVAPTPPAEGSHEILWIPALDAPTSYATEVANLRASMPWIVAKNASVVHRFAVRYFREHWHFNREPIVVALNYSGWVECLNSMPMIRMWGIRAFPFTEREIPGLLAGKTWLEIVIVPIIPTIQKWVSVCYLHVPRKICTVKAFPSFIITNKHCIAYGYSRLQMTSTSYSSEVRRRQTCPCSQRSRRRSLTRSELRSPRFP